MGRTITPKYKVEVSTAHPTTVHTPSCWDGRHAGRANAKNLATWVDLFNASLQPGMCNSHLVDEKHPMELCLIRYARLSLNDGSDATIAEYCRGCSKGEAHQCLVPLKSH